MSRHGWRRGWALALGLATFAVVGCSGPKTYRIDRMTEVEAMIGPDRDSALNPLFGAVDVGEYSEIDPTPPDPPPDQGEVGADGMPIGMDQQGLPGGLPGGFPGRGPNAEGLVDQDPDDEGDGAPAADGGGGGAASADERSKIAFPIGPPAHRRFREFIKEASSRGAIGPTDANAIDVIVTPRKGGSFVLVEVSLSGDYLKEKGAKGGGYYSISYSSFELVQGNERLQPIILSLMPDDPQPSGNTVIFKGNSYPAAYKPALYKAELQKKEPTTMSGGLSLRLLFPRPSTKGQAKLVLFGGG